MKKKDNKSVDFKELDRLSESNKGKVVGGKNQSENDDSHIEVTVSITIDF